MSLWSNPLVSWSITNCYDSWIVSWFLHLSDIFGTVFPITCHMVLLEYPFTSCIEKCGQQPLYVPDLEKAKNFAGPDLNQNFFAEKVRMILVAKRPKLM